MTNRELLISILNYKLSKYSGNYNIDKISDDIKALNNMNDSDVTDHILSELIINLKKNRITPIQSRELCTYLLRLNNGYKNYRDVGKRAIYLDAMNLVNVDESLESNHTKVKHTLTSILPYLDSIDYYLSGGVSCYINTNGKFQRYHNNIDILINEEDLLKLKEILKSSNFSLQDERLLTKNKLNRAGYLSNNSRDLYINYENGLKINLSLFRREEDNSITRITYYLDNDKIRMYLEPTTVEQTKLIYSNKKKYYHGYQYKSVTLEAMYLQKKQLSLKDKYDSEYIKPYLNASHLNKLEEANITSKMPYTKDIDRVPSISVKNKVLKKI